MSSMSNFNALQVRYEQRFVAGLTLLNSFTWEHSLDNASASLEGNTPSPQNGFNLRADYAQSDYNLPVANVTSLVYDLPVGQSRRFLNNANPVLNAVAGGWQISAINTTQAGTPFNITYSPNAAQAVSPQISATYRGANEYRPDHVPGQKITQGTSNRAANTGYVNYINNAAFVMPPVKDANGNVLSPFGNASRNPGRTPPFNETDLDLNKRFNLPVESMKIEFRAEAYNLFNHTNFYLPGNDQRFAGNDRGGHSAEHRSHADAFSNHWRQPHRRWPDHVNLRAAYSAVCFEADLLVRGKPMRRPYRAAGALSLVHMA